MNRPRRVAIVGAGPAGLVAAKTLLRDHPPGTFEAVVFEARSSIGGLWPLHKHHVRPGSVNPDMRTNLSRFTVCFSDFAWESVMPEGIRLGRNGDGDGDGDLPMFPRAWQVGRYLMAYAKKYLLDDSIKFNCKVISAVRGKFQDDLRWRLQWVDSASQNNSARSELDGEQSSSPEHELKSNSADFDFLIVASGFFSKPLIPDIPGLKDFPGKVIQNANLGTIDDLLCPSDASLSQGEQQPRQQQIAPSPEQGSKGIPKKIVVIGGSMSGAEAAASLALQLSSATHSPTPSRHLADLEIYHITTRPFWCLSPYLPTDPVIKETNEFNPAPSFLPLDLIMFDISRRPPNEVASVTSLISAEKARMMNGYFKTLIGSNQSDVAYKQLAIEGDTVEKPPWIAINDGYSEFVRDETIKVELGRVEEVIKASGDAGSVKISHEGDINVLHGVVALVLATGYAIQPSLEFLTSDVLETLEYEPNNNFLPILLEKNNTIHPALPDLGFVGFYRGPYWGIMEMQSRFLAHLWSGSPLSPKLALSSSPDQSPSIALMRHLRSPTAVEAGQFPMGDYVGVMESFRTLLSLPRHPLPAKPGLVSPPRYHPNDPVANPVVATHLSALTTALSPRYLGRATFRALQGTWSLSRTLTSALPGFPSGTFTGTATLHPRVPTYTSDEEGNHDLYSAEYLYIESGELITREGLRLQASRRYVYRYSESGDRISVWFVKPDDAVSVDYFFHELEFLPHKAGEVKGEAGYGDGEEGWRAKGTYHLCVEDEYESSYRFLFRGVAVKEWRVGYKVKGPKKDYTTETWYVRR